MHDLETALAEANSRLTRIDEADKRLGASTSAEGMPPPQKAGPPEAGVSSVASQAHSASKPVESQSHDASSSAQPASKSEAPVVQKQ